TGTSNSLAQPGSKSNSRGNAAGTLASTKAEMKTISAMVTPSLGGAPIAVTQTVNVSFLGNPATIDLNGSTVIANPTSGVLANGTAKSDVTVTLIDANGNAVAGQTVTIGATGGGNTIVQAPATTDANGNATAELRSTGAGTKTITATITRSTGGQVVLTGAPTVGFVADPSTISAAGSTVAANPATGIIANGTDASTITITVVDANGNPVANQPVSLTTTAGPVFTQPAVTNASGVTTG